MARQRPQSPLASAYDAEGKLAQLVEKPLKVTWTRNKRTYLSYRWPPEGTISLRLHERFREAEPQVLEAVAEFIRGTRRKEARAVLNAFWQEHGTYTPPSRRPPHRASPQGKYADLEKILASVMKEVGLDGAPPSIGWGRNGRRRVTSHIRLGSYDFEARHITIHPKLDQQTVPRAVLRQIVHHELLHHIFGVEIRNGRRVLHPPALRERERRFSDYVEAQAWLDTHLPKLLGQRR